MFFRMERMSINAILIDNFSIRKINIIVYAMQSTYQLNNPKGHT